MKCTARFLATRIYRTDCFFQSPKTLFVAGTYDLPENLGEVLEQFHRLAAQYRSLLSPRHLALYVNAREQNTHHKAEGQNLKVLAAPLLPTWQFVTPDCQWMGSGLKSPRLVSRHAFAPIHGSLQREPVSVQAQNFLPKSPGKGIAR